MQHPGLQAGTLFISEPSPECVPVTGVESARRLIRLAIDSGREVFQFGIGISDGSRLQLGRSGMAARETDVSLNINGQNRDPLPETLRIRV
jgi:hypothetical protein